MQRSHCRAAVPQVMSPVMGCVSRKSNKEKDAGHLRTCVLHRVVQELSEAIDSVIRSTSLQERQDFRHTYRLMQ